MSKRIVKESTSEVKILSSSFIASAYPCNSIEEVTTLFNLFKEKNPKADHYPYAYKCNGVSKSSDDGEPSGTAGRQFLELLNRENLDNSLIIVARYFGGKKLGVGRLARTFVDVANQALMSSKKGQIKSFLKYKVELSYSDYEVFKKIGTKNNIIFKAEEFNETVLFEILVSQDVKLDENDYKIKFLKLNEVGKEDIVVEENYD